MKQSTKKTNKQTDISKTDFYKYIIENSQEAFLLTKPDGTIDYANPEACKLFGRTLKEICKLGRNGLVDLNDPRLPIALEERKKKGRFKGELNFIRKDGTIFPAVISSVIFKDADGIERTSMIIRDISMQKKLEESFKQHEQLITSIYRSAPIGIGVVINRIIKEANEQLCAMTGYSKEELINKNARIFYPSDKEYDYVGTEKYKQISEKGTGTVETIWKRKNGEMINVLISSSPLVIGKIEQGVTFTVLDITKSKKAEEELFKSESKYRTLFQNSALAIGIRSKEGEYIEFNDAYAKMLGYTNEELKNLKSKDITHPDDIHITKENMKLIAEGKAEMLKYEKRYIHKNGNIVWALVCIRPLLDNKGKINAIIGAVVDITKNKIAENEIKERERQLSTLISNLPGFAYRCKNDREWTMIYISEGCTKITGYSPEELIDSKVLSFNDIILEKYREILWNKWQKLLKEKETFIDEYEIKTKSGEIRWVWERGNGVFDEKGKLLYLEGYIEDITEKRKAEKALKISEEKFRKAFITSPDSININRMEDGLYESINEGFTELTGFTEEDVKNKTSMDLNIWENPDDRKKLQDELREKGTAKNLEFRFRMKNGDIKNGLMSASIMDLEGVPHIISITRDITERKKIEEAIRESERKFRETVENLQTGYYRCTLDGILLEHNPAFCEMLGFKSEENLRGLKLPEFWQDSKDRDKYLEEMEKKGFIKNYPVNAKKNTGEKIYVLLNSHLLKDKDGKYCGIEGSVVDLTEQKRMEELLKESEEKYQTLFNQSVEGIYLHDINGKIIDVNQKACEQSGYTKEELLKLNIFDLHPEKSEKNMPKSEILKLWKEWNPGNEFVYDVEHKRKDGTIFPTEISTGVVRFSNNNFILALVKDITERKQAEEAIHKNRNLLNETQRLAHIGGWEWDIERQTMTWTDETYRIHGIEPGEPINDSRELINLSLTCYDPTDRPIIESAFRRCAIKGESYDLEFPFTRIDGKRIWIQTMGRAEKVGNRVIKVVGNIIDITERKKAEKALKESEEKYRNLIETMPEGFYRSTAEGYFLDVNPAMVKMLGYNSKEELMKVYIPEELYFSKEERTVVDKYNVDFIPETEIYRLKKKDGSEIWVEDHSRYVQDETGKILFHEGIMRDITDSLKAQKAIVEAKEKAEEANRLKSIFLANMSHEIRTPLNGILGFSQILKSEMKDESLIRYADIIEKSGNRLLETLDMILSFSKLEAEREDVRYTNVRIENVIEEVKKSFEAMAKSKNLYLNTTYGEKGIKTKTDERFLRQILNNLINNAIKYTNAGGVEIELSKTENDVLIKVKDTGKGIAKDKFDIIFEEFRQESEGHGRSFEGTGLGLAITKRFVELMKGKIEVESELGVGTTFTVILPYEKAEQSINIKIKKEEPKIDFPITKDKLSVLLVENDTMNLDYTITLLKPYYNIESALNGPEAIEKVKNKKYDIILMDINLGKGMDGVQAVKEIKKLSGYKKTPIVALTAFVLPGDREEFLASGCTHYLGKPFTKNQILDLLKKISDNIKK